MQAAETVSMPLEEHEARQPVIDVLMVAVIVVAGMGFCWIGVDHETRHSHHPLAVPGS